MVEHINTAVSSFYSHRSRCGSSYARGVRILGGLGERPERLARHKTHMGFNQEAYDAECAAIVRALDLAAERQQRWRRLEKVTVFTDAQAAITRMQTCEVGLGQRYALRAREALARIKAPVEIRWCPAHEGIEGNEIADGWAKLAADEPDSHGVEWLRHSDKYGGRRMSLPASLAHLKRRISEKKWTV